jgi:hypothetical protein
MTQYLMTLTIVLIVISPVLVPAIITLVHQSRIAARALATRRRTAPSPSLA